MPIQPLKIDLGRNAFNNIAKEVGKFNNYTTSNGLQATRAHGVKTLDIATCTGINLNTEANYNKMWHLAPEFVAHQNFNFLMKFFQEQVFKMQDQYGKIRAFIFGGIEHNAKNQASKESFNLYSNIADILEQLNVEFSMLCGKRSGVITKDNMHVIDNKLTIWNDAFKELGNNPEKLDKAAKLDFLRDKYQFVETTADDFFTIL